MSVQRTGDGAGHELGRVGESEMETGPGGDHRGQGDADGEHLADPTHISSTERRRLQNREAARRFQNKKKKYIDDLKGQISSLEAKLGAESQERADLMQTNLALNTLLAESLAQLRTYMFVIGKLTEAEEGVRNMPSTDAIDLHFERFNRIFKQRLCGIAPDVPGAALTTSMPTGAAPLRPRPPSMVQRPAGHGGASVPVAGASTARDEKDLSLLMVGGHTAADLRLVATNTERAGGGAAGTSAMAQGGGGAAIVGFPPSRAVNSVRLDPAHPPLRPGDQGQAAEQDIGATTLNRKKFIALSNALLGYGPGPPGT